MDNPYFFIETPKEVYFSQQRPKSLDFSGSGRIFNKIKELRWFENKCLMFFESEETNPEAWDIEVNVLVNVDPKLNPKNRIRKIRCIRYFRKGLEQHLRFAEVIE